MMLDVDGRSASPYPDQSILNSQKWIADRERTDALTILHIFGVEGVAAGLQGCGENQRPKGYAPAQEKASRPVNDLKAGVPCKKTISTGSGFSRPAPDWQLPLVSAYTRAKDSV
jgi:hypothetical protein